MPERERVAGVRSSVGKLGHGVERELVEGLELPDPRKVEERVPTERAAEAPEENAERDACSRDGPRRPIQRPSLRAKGEGERGKRDAAHDDQREQNRGPQRESRHQSEEEDTERERGGLCGGG
jgi:hypothetical protein